MGTHHDQNQERISLEFFTVYEAMEGDLTKSMRRARNNKAPGRDGVCNEIIKSEPELVAKLLVQVWKLIGRRYAYPTELTRGLVTTTKSPIGALNHTTTAPFVYYPVRER